MGLISKSKNNGDSEGRTEEYPLMYNQNVPGGNAYITLFPENIDSAFYEDFVKSLFGLPNTVFFTFVFPGSPTEQNFSMPNRFSFVSTSITVDSKKKQYSVFSSHLVNFDEESNEFELTRPIIQNLKPVVLKIHEAPTKLSTYYDFVVNPKTDKLSTESDIKVTKIEKISIFEKKSKINTNVYTMPVVQTGVVSVLRGNRNPQAQEKFSFFVFFNLPSLEDGLLHFYSMTNQKTACLVYETTKLKNNTSLNYFEENVRYWAELASIPNIKASLTEGKNTRTFYILFSSKYENGVVEYKKQSLGLKKDDSNTTFYVSSDGKTLCSRSLCDGLSNSKHRFILMGKKTLADSFITSYAQLPDVFAWNEGKLFDFVFMKMPTDYSRIIPMMLIDNEANIVAKKKFIIVLDSTADNLIDKKMTDKIKESSIMAYEKRAKYHLFFSKGLFDNGTKSIHPNSWFLLGVSPKGPSDDGKTSLSNISIGSPLDTDDLDFSFDANTGVCRLFDKKISAFDKTAPVLTVITKDMECLFLRKSFVLLPETLDSQNMIILFALNAENTSTWTFMRNIYNIKSMKNVVFLTNVESTLAAYPNRTAYLETTVTKNYKMITAKDELKVDSFTDNEIIFSKFGENVVKVAIDKFDETATFCLVLNKSKASFDYGEFMVTSGDVPYTIESNIAKIIDTEDFFGGPPGVSAIMVSGQKDNTPILKEDWFQRLTKEDMRYVVLLWKLVGEDLKNIITIADDFLIANSETTSLCLFIVSTEKINRKNAYPVPGTKLTMYSFVSKKPGFAFNPGTMTLTTRKENGFFTSPVKFEPTPLSEVPKVETNAITISLSTVTQLRSKPIEVSAPIDIDHRYSTIEDIPFTCLISNCLVIESFIDTNNKTGRFVKPTEELVKRRFGRDFSKIMPAEVLYRTFNNMKLKYQGMSMMLASINFEKTNNIFIMNVLKLNETHIRFLGVRDKILAFLNKSFVKEHHGLYFFCNKTFAVFNNDISVDNAVYGFQEGDTQVDTTKNFVIEIQNTSFQSSQKIKNIISDDKETINQLEIVDTDTEIINDLTVTSSGVYYRQIVSTILLVHPSFNEVITLAHLMDARKDARFVIVCVMEKDAPAVNTTNYSASRGLSVIVPEGFIAEIKPNTSHYFVKLIQGETYFKFGVWISEQPYKQTLANLALDFMFNKTKGTKYFAEYYVDLNLRTGLVDLGTFTTINKVSRRLEKFYDFTKNVKKEIVFMMPPFINNEDVLRMNGTTPNSIKEVPPFAIYISCQTPTGYFELAQKLLEKYHSLKFVFFQLKPPFNVVKPLKMQLGESTLDSSKIQYCCEDTYVMVNTDVTFYGLTAELMGFNVKSFGDFVVYRTPHAQVFFTAETLLKDFKVFPHADVLNMSIRYQSALHMVKKTFLKGGGFIKEKK